MTSYALFPFTADYSSDIAYGFTLGNQYAIFFHQHISMPLYFEMCTLWIGFFYNQRHSWN